MVKHHALHGAAAPARAYRGRRSPQHPRTPEDNARLAAAWVLERTLSSLAPASVFLESAMSRLDEREHALLRELALGSLRWLRRLDDVIAQASTREFDDIEAALLPPLRIAVYQLLFLDRMPHHAAVNEAVEQVGRRTHRGGASFANAVLRRIARSPRLADWPVRLDDPIRRLAIEMSHPDFLVERWVERFGPPRTEALLIANNQRKPMHLLAFRERGGRELLAERLIDEGMAVEPSALSPVGLIVREGNPLRCDAFAGGDFYLQDEACQLSALIPPPRAGERVWDAAAAPGGKSFALLAHQPRLETVLSDASPTRMLTLCDNLRRLGLSRPAWVGDAAHPPVGVSFDRVVLDLPCTGTGTLRKHPELKWRISEAEIGRLSQQALRMMEGAAAAVATGGILVAITCSLEREENEEVVGEFLQRNSGFSPLPLEGLLDEPAVRWIVAPGCWRIFPGGDHDGFSVQVLRRLPQAP